MSAPDHPSAFPWVTWCFGCDKRVQFRMMMSERGWNNPASHRCLECDAAVSGAWRDYPEEHTLYVNDASMKVRAASGAPLVHRLDLPDHPPGVSSGRMFEVKAKG